MVKEEKQGMWLPYKQKVSLTVTFEMYYVNMII